MDMGSAAHPGRAGHRSGYPGLRGLEHGDAEVTFQLAGLSWDWRDWSLSRRQRQSNVWHQLFAFRCVICLRWCLGCKDHWFCGICEECRVRMEGEA
jgi:hypothetical protein